MTRIHEISQELVQKVKQLLQERLPEDKARLISSFAELYFERVSAEDLLDRDIGDIYGSLLSLWNFIYEREPSATKIRINNPHYEQDGWQSSHTIIELAHDDMPFLVDSIRMEINRLGYAIHFMVHLGGVHVERNEQHEIVKVLEPNQASDLSCAEAPIYLEMDRVTDEASIEEIKENILRVLSDICAAVRDWSPMREKVAEALEDLDKAQPNLPASEIEESKDFLRWIVNNHFTFLGYREYELVGSEEERALKIIPNSGLGVLHDTSKSKTYHNFSELSPEALQMTLSPQVLILSKTNTISTVHRSAYTDYIAVKHFDDNGNLKGERRFIGLYTSTAYNSNPRTIPLLRLKVARVIELSKLPAGSHGGKEILNILETFPRDDLFQANVEELFEIVMGIMHLQERRAIRLFMRKDPYNRFISCFLYVPRDAFNTELREKLQRIIMTHVNGIEATYTTHFSSSVLARIHLVIKVDRATLANYNVREIEKELIVAARTWDDELSALLHEYHGEENANKFIRKYEHIFSAAYREDFTARTAVYDIEHIDRLSNNNPLEMSFYQPLDSVTNLIHFKLLNNLNRTQPLSDVIPIFENMGLRVISERPYELKLTDIKSIWINDFRLTHQIKHDLLAEDIRHNFQETFLKVWRGEAENDDFNSLVLSSGINWREIVLLRAYSRYLRQIGVPFSQSYIAQTLYAHPDITSKLIELFNCRFTPAAHVDEKKQQQLEKSILSALDQVQSLDEDRIIRLYLEVINATLRTNYYQKGSNKPYKSYLAFKILPQKISEMPKPYPEYEIYVYSTDFEGVHLRSGKVARGGLRWSDRKEDFRTEVLGLMKAQKVKNSVIVPTGAKGGFVTHCIPANAGREQVYKLVTRCYKDFIRGLLDITDNLKLSEVIKPARTICYDEDDTYLVVAADKGTATFSDIANEVADEYEFWLGDAFASGGKTGYDHKRMGITARGAWESVKRSFRELGVDTQKTSFSVVGIGDMAGDVFGNGMLLSEHIKLVAAFNHQHIFLDPHPNVKDSYAERKRLFDLPMSSWTDYNKELLSKGGAIYSRHQKFIKLQPEAKRVLRLKRDTLTPHELIHEILKMKVDLLWNGGIGTYVKSKNETHADVGDRSNDMLRINANELRCRVIGEGGNLGFTQLARIDFAKRGGKVYTDFIDNAGGVDCSDHEVNIKILLNQVMLNGDLTEKQRNQLLANMTEEVSELVLHNNYRQTQALSLATIWSRRNIDLHVIFIEMLQKQGKLDLTMEALPSKEELLERKADGQGLTRPELSTLMAYCKNYVKEKLLESDILEDNYFFNALKSAFPKPLSKAYPEVMKQHSLRREIIATQLANDMINKMGINFIQRMHDETGATIDAIAVSYTIAQSVFNMPKLWDFVEQLDGKVSAQNQAIMMLAVTRIVRRSTRWFLRHRQYSHSLNETITQFYGLRVQLEKHLHENISGNTKSAFDEKVNSLIENGVPDDKADKIAMLSILMPALEILEGASHHKLKLEDMADVYYSLNDQLELIWFRRKLSDYEGHNRWESLAITAFRDDFDWLQRELSAAITCQKRTDEQSIDDCVKQWLSQHSGLIHRWQSMLADLKSHSQIDIVMLTVALRELLDLVQASKPKHVAANHDE